MWQDFPPTTEEGNVWSFGSAKTSHSNLYGKDKKINLLKMSSVLPASTETNIKQYPIHPAAKQGINGVIKNLEQRNIFRTCSAFNSPVWPVKKKDRSWRLTVDYWRLNANTGPLIAAVLNIENLTVTLQASTHKWMAVLDIKDMFFMVPIQEEDKLKFAFTWKGTQYTFNYQPQRYKHSPTIAHNALAEFLQQIKIQEGVQIYQYIDDVLVGG